MKATRCKDYFLFKRGVSLSIPESAKPRLSDRMRLLIRETALAPVIFGTIVLAAAANLYELFCTAGFPMIYTRILPLHRLPEAEYSLYLGLARLLRPEALGSVAAGAWLLAGSVAVTALIVAAARRRGGAA